MRLAGLRLISSVALCSVVSISSAFAADSTGSVSSSEQAQYLSAIKRQYGSSNERQALLAHCNQLLRKYALAAKYQVGQTHPQDLLYQLSQSAPGVLGIREESQGQQGSLKAVNNRRVNLFGVDPFVRYECPSSGISCVLSNPVDGSPMITIVRDHDGAAELSKALSFLIRNMQKG